MDLPPYTPFASSSVTIAAGGISSSSIASTARGQIKSVQRVTFTFTNQQSIVHTLAVAVDPNRAELRYLGATFDLNTNVGVSTAYMTRVVLSADGTQVTGKRGGTLDVTATPLILGCEVTDYY